MSQELISHSRDLKRLQDEGYDIDFRANHLVVNNVPYVNARMQVQYGKLISELTLADDVTTATPGTHVAYFAGDHPCNKDGSEISAIKHGSAPTRIDQDLVANHSFSNKPSYGYKDYYEKMTRYIAIICNPARSIDPTVSAITFPVIECKEEESVFNYRDTASSRAGIYAIARKLELGRVGIVGLGGTGAYVLDLVAKTLVKEIHLFDGDQYLLHNAFRSPGAASAEELRRKLTKVAHFKEQYSKMRRNIVPHEYFVGADNVDELRNMDFVFLCIDGGGAKKLIVEKLEEFAISFIDVGMGVYEVEHSLAGTLRVTTSTNDRREHVKKRVSLADDDGKDDYSRNIQIADLNALNAALAVIKWKKLFGFYIDLDHEYHSTYTINGNMLTNEELG
jgi:hypothetical protein